MIVGFIFFVSFLFMLSAGVTGQYESCTGQLDYIDDGACNYENNNIDCGYDGGDCCECSCTNDRLFPCGIWGFNCFDSNITGHGGDCSNELSSVRPCASDAPVTWLVNDTASAMSLAEAVNCSGGTFNVIWLGSVLVNRTFYIPNGTTLYVTGEGSGAEVKGDGKTRLFMGVSANLHIKGLILSNGRASYGGAIAATRSSILLNLTVFSGNTASTYGGAINVGITSTLVWEGKTMFIGNYAGVGGGAVAVSMGSQIFCNSAEGYESVGGADLWDEVTLFTNNTAYYGGALYIVWDCIVSSYGETSFENNTANGYGGALYIGSDCTVSSYGETSFENNTANGYGGALFMISNCIVSWYGDTCFIGNMVNDYGGALAIYDSIVSWYGETSFIGNTANTSGGALVILNSSVSWHGDTFFIGNVANRSGGSLGIYFDSIVSWYGDTSFIGNTANDFGGALFIWVSVVSWYGDTSFIGNTAIAYGGALFIVTDSNVSCYGNTSFTGNVANLSGGGIYVGLRSKISMGGDFYFLDNEADVDGGAAYVYVGYDGETPSYFISDNSAALFQGNTYGGNGGAIVLIGDVVTRFSPKTTFLENSAGVAGGAIYMSGVTFGIVFEGLIFKSNSAVIGGGLYSTGSGIAVTGEIGEYYMEALEYNPTTLIGCEFIGNTAIKTGGAMDSGAGRDSIENTSFVGNTASLGGALRLVGTTSLIGCDFVNNLSGEDDGPGISNDGVISASNCSFVGNVFNCQTGFYLGYKDTNALFDTVCKGCDTQCTGCTVKDKEPICLEELEHSNSTGGNTTLESLLVERGYWRATNRSKDILACYNKDACPGGRTEDQGYCSEGYEGPYCSVCSNRYTASPGFTCNKCSDNADGGIVLAVATGVVILLFSIAFLSYMLSGKMEGADQGIVARVKWFIPLQSIKIVIVIWQILTQFSTVANVVFPSVYQRFLDGVDILNFDLSWLLSTECIIDTDFHDQLLLATLGPLVCLVILGGTYAAAMRISRNSETARGIVRRKHVSMVLLLTFLVYSSVSSTLFETFACDKLDDDKNYLRADYRIECDSSKHIALEIYAGFMVILYVVGIPVFYGALLYKIREALVNTPGSEEDEGMKVIADLWKPYKPDRFYYEIIECIRRVLLTGALVFIYPNTAAQIAVALMMATFFIFVSEALAPYTSKWDTWCSRTGHAIVFTSMFLALLLKVDVSGERASSQRVFEWVLIGAHACLVLVVVVEAIAMIVACRQEVKEDTRPRTRESLSVSSPGVGRIGTILEEDGVTPPL